MSRDDTKNLLLEELKNYHPTDNPKISLIEELPEVILFQNLSEANDLTSIPDGKEIIVDVHCAASILRGKLKFT